MEEYLPIKISFEAIEAESYNEVQSFLKNILNQIKNYFRFSDNENIYAYINEKSNEITNLYEFSNFITNLVEYANKKIVLIIDEVDKNSDNQLFLDFLSVLRNKFIMANEDLDYTFHSVVLAGVHDVKNLKLKLRQEEEKKYNSPWNIAVNFKVDMSFSSDEIETMLKEYCEDRNLHMDTKLLSQRIFFFTGGYPFLVSRLCQIIDEDILERSKEPWSVQDIEHAVKIILRENNTLFDSLIKNLENNNEFKDFIERLILLGEEIVYVPSEPNIVTGILYGFIKEENNKCMIHNKIFEHYIYNHLSAKKTVENESITNYNYRNNFITENNALDFEKILLKYQQFMKEQYSKRDQSFIEREGRLLFLAFIKPIINGVGFDFKEVQISEEKRLDVVVTYNQYKYVIELKIWRGEEYHKRGLRQLYEYLDIQGLDKGYLVIYDFSKNKSYKKEQITFEGKEIYIVWV
jgi:hypothetical protein